MKMLPSRFPIIQAPMVGCLSPLVTAVSEAGGLGSLACAALSPVQAREQIAAIRADTSAPFNINFFCHVPPSADADRQKAWRKLLTPYYQEAGLDISAVPGERIGLPSIRRCAS